MTGERGRRKQNLKVRWSRPTKKNRDVRMPLGTRERSALSEGRVRPAIAAPQPAQAIRGACCPVLQH